MSRLRTAPRGPSGSSCVPLRPKGRRARERNLKSRYGESRRTRRGESFQCFYGLRPVLEILRAGRREVEGLWLLEGRKGPEVEGLLAEAKGRGLTPSFLPRRALEDLAGTRDHQGVVARAGPLPLVGLEELLGEAKKGSLPPLLLFLDGVQDPRNLGALVRSVGAFGGGGVVFTRDRTAPPSPVAAKAAAGALDRVSLCRVVNLARALEEAKEEGFWVLGLDEEGERDIDEVPVEGPLALVVGGEGGGLRRLVRERCDHLVRIPTEDWPSTLNVSVAVGIALYEVRRRRGSK